VSARTADYRSPSQGRLASSRSAPSLPPTIRELATAAAQGLERLAAACHVTYLIVQPTGERAEVITPQLLQDGYRTAPEVMAPTTPRQVCWI
jgi:hypothetical protein